MKREIEDYLDREYYQRFYRSEGRRIIISAREDLGDDKYQARIIEVRLARNLGLFQLIPFVEQEVLNCLYPESLRLPTIGQTANKLHLSRQTVSKREKGGIKSLEKLLEKTAREALRK